MPLELGTLLDDPDFVIGFQVARRTRTTDDHGRAVTEEEILPARGAVQSATPEELERLPEGDRHKESISVWTLFALRDGNTDAPCIGVEIDDVGLVVVFCHSEDYCRAAFIHCRADLRGKSNHIPSAGIDVLVLFC